MSHKVKLFGLLCSVLALSGATAAAAQAAPEFSAKEFPASVIADHVGEVVLKDQGGSIECEEAAYTGKLEKAPSSTLTLSPIYNKCNSAGFPVTFTWNGCGYLLHLKEKTGAETYRGTFDFACPSGKVIEAKAYSDAGHTKQVCKLTIASQAGFLTVNYTNVTVGEQKKVDMVLNVGKFTYSQEGTGCATGKFANGELLGSVIMEAKNSLGNLIDFEIVKE